MTFRRQFFLRLTILVSLDATTGCGSEAAPLAIRATDADAGEQTPPTPPPSPTSTPDASPPEPPAPAIELSLALTPSSTVLSADETKTIAIAVRGAEDQVVDLGIDNVPLGVSAFIDPLQSTGSATLTLSAAASATPGKFTASVRAQAGIALARAEIEIEIVAPGPSFDAALAPTDVAASPGDVVGFAISVVRRGGFTGPLTVSAISLPVGFEADTFSIPAGATSGVLNVRTHPMLPPHTNASFEIDIASETLGTKQLTASISVSPHPGTLDTSFGQGGSTYHSVKIPVGGYNHVGLISESGQFAVGGAVDDFGVEHRFGVTALSPEGAFWWNGWTSFTNENGVELPYPVVRAIAPITSSSYNRLVVVGDTDASYLSTLAFAAFGNAYTTVTGTLETCSYGSHGWSVRVDPETAFSPWSAVVAGTCGGIAMLSRWQSDATLDTTSGTNGITDMGGPYAALKMASVPKGGTFVAGQNSSVLVVRKAGASNGLDPNYGAGGIADTGVVATDIYAVRAYEDGSVIVAVESYINPKIVTKLVRLTPSGSLDSSFGSGGVATLGLSGVHSLAESNAGWLVGGVLNTSFRPAVVRVLANGQIDTSFGLAGTAELLSSPAYILAVRSLPGRIVVLTQDSGGVYVSKLWE